MILLADIGNTHSVFGISDGKEVLASWRLTTGKYETEDELFAHLAPFFERNKVDFGHIESFVVASVVPYVNPSLERFAVKYLNTHILWVTARTDLPIVWNVPAPSQIGADRVANVLGGWEKYGENIIVVDFGTAITIDVLHQNRFEGGAILPGLMTALHALFRKAAKLPQVELEMPCKPVGKDTDENIRVGIVMGTRYAIEGIIAEIQKTYGTNFPVVATGGEAFLIFEHSEIFEEFDPDLTIKGILVYSKVLRIG